MHIINSLRKLEHKFDTKAEQFLFKHPFLGFLFVFVGLPVIVLTCVCCGTAAIAFSAAWLSGWL